MAGFYCRHHPLDEIHGIENLLLHILEETLTLKEELMALDFTALNDATTQLTTAAQAAVTALSNSTEPADQAAINNAASTVTSVVTQLQAAVPQPAA